MRSKLAYAGAAMASTLAAVAFTASGSAAAATPAQPDGEMDWGIIGTTGEMDWGIIGTTGEMDWG